MIHNFYFVGQDQRGHENFCGVHFKSSQKITLLIYNSILLKDQKSWRAQCTSSHIGFKGIGFIRERNLGPRKKNLS